MEKTCRLKDSYGDELTASDRGVGIVIDAAAVRLEVDMATVLRDWLDDWLAEQPDPLAAVDTDARGAAHDAAQRVFGGTGAPVASIVNHAIEAYKTALECR
jgi:hypothetical protein